MLCSIWIVFHIHSFQSACIFICSGWVVLPQLGLRVSRRALQQLCLGSHFVFIFTCPSLQCGVLERTGIREGDVPGVWRLVHCIEVECSLNLRLPSRQKHDARDCWRHHLVQRSQRVVGNGFCISFGSTLCTRCDHRGFYENTLQHHTKICTCLEDSGPCLHE